MFEPLPATILVVDPARPVREALKLHLGAAGYEVVTAKDAVEAGRLVLENPPALLITDVGMPYLSGVELVTALRSDATLPTIPVVFLSAGEPSVEERRLRPIAWVKKPVDPQRVLDIAALHIADPAALAF